MPTCERFQLQFCWSRSCKIISARDLYTQYYTQLAGPDGVLELSKVQHKFNTIRSHTQKKTTKQTNKKPKLFKGKLVVPLFKPHSWEWFKRANAKPLDLVKEIGELPLSQSEQHQSGEHSISTSDTCTQNGPGTGAKWNYSKSSPSVPVKKKKTQLLDLMERIGSTENENETHNNKYTSPFADIGTYREATCMRVPVKDNTCMYFSNNT